MKRILEVYLISFVQIVSSCYQRAEPETYLIPSNFTGEVNILFNQNGVPTKYKNEYGQDTIYTPKIGNPMKYENGRRVYERYATSKNERKPWFSTFYIYQ